MGPLHMKFGLLSILVNASQCGMYHAEINLQCYSGPDGSPHLLSSSRISWAESLDVKLQLIRCYLHFFSRWKTRNLATVCGKHLPENCITVQGVGSQKKKQGKGQTHQSVLHLKIWLCLQVKMKPMLSAWSLHDHLPTMQNHHLIEYGWQFPLKKESWLEQQSLIQVRLEVWGYQNTEGI